MDLNIIPVLKKETHLPVIVDPSHGTGKADLVLPMSKASIACGADGFIKKEGFTLTGGRALLEKLNSFLH